MDAITAPSSTFSESVWMQINTTLGISLMDHLFNRLDGAYPRKWRADFQNEIAIANWRETWSEAFDEEGITPIEIKTGLRNCRSMFDWPPSLTEFLRACRPGLNPEVAFHEAVHCLAQRRRGERGDWTHPAIYHAAVKTGQHDVSSASYTQIRTRWDRALSDELAKGDWPAIPEAHAALPEPRKTETSNAEAAQAMKRIGADKALERKGTDMKAWARKIVESPQGRPLIAVTMAKRALELS